MGRGEKAVTFYTQYLDIADSKTQKHTLKKIVLERLVCANASMNKRHKNIRVKSIAHLKFYSAQTAITPRQDDRLFKRREYDDEIR